MLDVASKRLKSAATLLFVLSGSLLAHATQSGPPEPYHEEALAELAKIGHQPSDVPGLVLYIQASNWWPPIPYDGLGSPAETSKSASSTKIRYNVKNISKWLRLYGIDNPNGDHEIGFLCGTLLHEWQHVLSGKMDNCEHFWSFYWGRFELCDAAGDYKNLEGSNPDIADGFCAAYEHNRAMGNRLLDYAKGNCGAAIGHEEIPPCPDC